MTALKTAPHCDLTVCVRSFGIQAGFILIFSLLLSAQSILVVVGEGQINPLLVQILCVSHRSESKRLIFMLCHAPGVLTWCECVQS